MGVSAIGTSVETQQLVQQIQSGEDEEQLQQLGPPPMMPQDDVAFSQLGQLLNQLSDEGQDEMESMREEIMQMVKDGDIDAAALAQNAPAELKALAEEQGIDLESLFSDVAESMQEMDSRMGSMPPPPPMGQGAGQDLMSQSESDSEGEDSSSLTEDANGNGIPDVLEAEDI